jgi:geranylgeranyl diphosphate synthase type II
MIEFGFHLGAAFQIRDDILNLVGDPDVYGKEALGDLMEGKRTLMLIHLLASADPGDRSWLIDYLARPAAERDQEDVIRVLELMLSYGSIAFAGEFATGVARSATTSMDAAFAGRDDTSARRFIAGLVPYMIERAS